MGFIKGKWAVVKKALVEDRFSRLKADFTKMQEEATIIYNEILSTIDANRKTIEVLQSENDTLVELQKDVDRFIINISKFL